MGGLGDKTIAIIILLFVRGIWLPPPPPPKKIN